MSLLNNLEHPTQAGVWKGDLPVFHRYTAGIAGEKFLLALRDEGKLFGTKCPKCGYVYVPARIYCERDATHLDDATWVQVGPEGELVSFSAVYIDLDGKRLDAPQWVGLVRLNGASGVLVHYLGEVKGNLSAGMKVQMVLKAKKDRVGSIKDIAYFKPV